jgi:hypothetical protein
MTLKHIMQRITLPLIAGAAVFAAQAQEATITSVTGKVEIQEAGSSTWVAAKAQDTLSKGAKISTGFNSYATINLDGSVCTLQPLTRIELEKLEKQAVGDGSKTLTKTNLFIDTGRAAFKVNSTENKLNSFKVHSPAATASVRGTEFEVDAAGNIETTEGKVGVVAYSTRSAAGTDSEETVTEEEETEEELAPAAQETIVAAGQSTAIDTSTGSTSTPQEQMIAQTQLISGSTETLSSKETSTTSTVAAATNAAAAATGAAEAVGTIKTAASGTIVITLTFSN